MFLSFKIALIVFAMLKKKHLPSSATLRDASLLRANGIKGEWNKREKGSWTALTDASF
jgi:hypothetical protein